MDFRWLLDVWMLTSPAICLHAFTLDQCNGCIDCVCVCMCGCCDGCITFQYCLHGVIHCLNVLWVMMMILEMVPAILEYIKKQSY